MTCFFYFYRNLKYLIWEEEIKKRKREKFLKDHSESHDRQERLKKQSQRKKKKNKVTEGMNSFLFFVFLFVKGQYVQDSRCLRLLQCIIFCHEASPAFPARTQSRRGLHNILPSERGVSLEILQIEYELFRYFLPIVFYQK